MSNIPEVIKPGLKYTTTWANNKFISWELVDVTQNQAYLKGKDGTEFSTHVNNLRTPITKQVNVEAIKKEIKKEINIREITERAKYCVVDVETSGFSEKTNAVVQLSAIIYDREFVELYRFDRYIAPYRNSFGFMCTYTSSAEKIHGLSQRWLQDNGHYVLKVVGEFIQICRAFRPEFYVGHNINKFDKKFIASLIALNNLQYSRDFNGCSFIDTLELSKKAYPGVKSHSLETMCNFLNIQHPCKHNSIEDSESTAKVLEKLKDWINVK